MPTLPVDIDGLNLILGGGVPLIKRDEDLGESATILIRGTPGSGKTIFGTQLAGSIARSLKCDVAYGCVELLPTELAAQHAGLGRDVPERVVVSPFAKQEAQSDECRIFAGLLDIGEAGQEQERLEPAVLGLLAAVEEAGGRPRVLVIDSLSDGYRLGSSAPRELADALCKLAVQRGMVLILLEESSSLAHSAWSFATDLVLHVGASEDEHAPGMPPLFERRLLLIKQRFGPSDPGPHRFMILPKKGVQALPRPTSYLLPWVASVTLAPLQGLNAVSDRWGLTPIDDAATWPKFSSCITAVYGPDPHLVLRVARQLGNPTREDQTHSSVDIFLDFTSYALYSFTQFRKAGSTWIVEVGNPFINGNQIISRTLRILTRAKKRNTQVQRLLIGDMRVLRTFHDSDGVRRAINILLALLRHLEIPAILFESTPTSKTLNPDGAFYSNIGSPEPPVIDFADVIIEIRRPHLRAPRPVIAVDIRSGRQIEWECEP